MALTATGLLKKLQFNFKDQPHRVYIGGAAHYPNLQANVIESIRSALCDTPSYMFLHRLFGSRPAMRPEKVLRIPKALAS